MGSGVSSAQCATGRDQKGQRGANFGARWHTLCPNRPGQLMAVGSADDNVTLQPGVCDLASHVGVGASHNHPEKNIKSPFLVSTASTIILLLHTSISSSDQPPFIGSG